MVEFYSGKNAGTTFEKLFERQCLLSGFWAEANLIKARRGWKGRLQELKSNLDYTVIRGGKVGFFDCKTFDKAYFVFSDIPEHQLDLAVRYNRYQIPSGFVVWLRPQNAVIFCQGDFIEARGPGSRFDISDGTYLGRWGNFVVDPILSYFPMGSPPGIVP